MRPADHLVASGAELLEICLDPPSGATDKTADSESAAPSLHRAKCALCAQLTTHTHDGVFVVSCAVGRMAGEAKVLRGLRWAGRAPGTPGRPGRGRARGGSAIPRRRPASEIGWEFGGDGIGVNGPEGEKVSAAVHGCRIGAVDRLGCDGPQGCRLDFPYRPGALRGSGRTARFRLGDRPMRRYAPATARASVPMPRQCPGHLFAGACAWALPGHFGAICPGIRFCPGSRVHLQTRRREVDPGRGATPPYPPSGDESTALAFLAEEAK